MRALSIGLPYRELILRRIKKIEYRLRATKIIGERFYIYAARKWAGVNGHGRDGVREGEAPRRDRRHGDHRGLSARERALLLAPRGCGTPGTSAQTEAPAAAGLVQAVLTCRPVIDSAAWTPLIPRRHLRRNRLRSSLI